MRPATRPVKEEEVKKEIQEALLRSAQLDAKNIDVQVVGSKAILKGTVRSWAEKDEAENAAWAVPGILEVENRLEVIP